MQALDFTPREIAEELQRRGDKHLYKLVQDTDSGTVLSSQERRVINKLRAINQPKVTQYVLDGLTMLIRAARTQDDDEEPERERERGDSQ
jgi:CHASE3 domain sensor protein